MLVLVSCCLVAARLRPVPFELAVVRCCSTRTVFACRPGARPRVGGRSSRRVMPNGNARDGHAVSFVQDTRRCDTLASLLRCLCCLLCWVSVSQSQACTFQQLACLRGRVAWLVSFVRGETWWLNSLQEATWQHRTRSATSWTLFAGTGVVVDMKLKRFFLQLRAVPARPFCGIAVLNVQKHLQRFAFFLTFTGSRASVARTRD